MQLVLRTAAEQRRLTDTVSPSIYVNNILAEPRRYFLGQHDYATVFRLGSRLLIIGQGDPERATAYGQRYSWPCPVLCDPDFRAYEAYGRLEGKASQIADSDGALEFIRLDDAARAKYAEERRKAGRPPVVDNPFQLPGEFIVDNDATVRLAYRYQYCDNCPDPEALVTAFEEAAAESRTF